MALGLEARRTDRSFAAARLLYISGYAEQAITEDSLDSSSHFLQKPFNPTALIERVREVLDLPRGS